MPCSPHLHPQPSSCSFTAPVLSVVPQGCRFGGTPQTSTGHSYHSRRLQTPCSRCRLPACCCRYTSTCMWCYLVRWPAHIHATDIKDQEHAYVYPDSIIWHAGAIGYTQCCSSAAEQHSAGCMMHSKRQLRAFGSLHDMHQWTATGHHHCGMTTKLLFGMHCSMGPVPSH